MSAETPIGGTCHDAFSAVRDAFVANFDERGEHGGAVCVSVGGQRVVDLWGGWADASRTRPWAADTLVNVFSVGKGLSAVCAAVLIGRAVLDVDAPLASYWPEFGANGKDLITAADVLSHRAGLPAVRKRLPPRSMLQWDVMTEALAAERPWWPPGAAHGYHVNTFGFLVGEIVRRTDGRSLGRVLRDDIASPLGADVHIGVDASDMGRIAEFLWPGQSPPEVEPPNLNDEQLMEFNAYMNPSGLSGAGVVNTPEWRAAELPSTNGHATARGVERIYAALATGGALDDVRIVEPEVLEAMSIERSVGEDLVLHRASRFGLGFQLTQPERPLGPNRRSFGHFGAGGALGFCDPDAGVAFGYVMNGMGPRWQNPRNTALIESTYASISGAA